MRARSAQATVLAMTMLQALVRPLSVHGQAPEAEALDGTWRGTLTTARAPLRLSFRLSKRPDGIYLGTFTSLDEGGAQLPIDRVHVAGDSVQMEIRTLGATFTATRSSGERLSGSWKQGTAPLALELTRAAEPIGAPGSDRQLRAPQPVAGGFPFPLLLDVTAPLTPFVGGGKTHVAYEVRMTNYNVVQEAFLTSIDVISADTTVARFEGVELNALVANPFAKDGVDNRVIEPGRGALAFLWLTFDTGTRIPAALRHRITLLDGGTVEGGAVVAQLARPAPLGPPLHGADWVAAGGPSNRAPHRHALFQVDGKSRISQRFAIDWIKIGADGRPFAGDPADNKNYHAYGAEVVAVASATVASIWDGIPDNTPGARAVPITLETAGGNHVILDLGDGRFAFYAHVQPGSLRVKVGDRVRRGQVIALVGNSGNSQFPHLHFHVADANSPFAAEGLPYGLESFEVMTASGSWDRRRNEVPLASARVRFPERGDRPR